MSVPAVRGLDVHALHEFLAARPPGVGPLHAEPIAGGRSNLTYRLTDGRSTWVLRRPPLGGLTPSAHDMAREFRVVAALRGTGVPVAGAVVQTDDPSVIGAPFALVEYVDGRVVRTRADLDRLPAADVARCAYALVEVLARLHAVDPAAVGRRRRDGHPEPAGPAQRLHRDDGPASWCPRWTRPTPTRTCGLCCSRGRDAGSAPAPTSAGARGRSTRRARSRRPGRPSSARSTACRGTSGASSPCGSRPRKPVIVAVNGPAVGVGVTMTLPADIRIAAGSARFGFVFSRRGLVPEAASSWFLPRLVGISQAMEWVATGRVFDAAEALAGRLVSRVVPDAELLPAARPIAAEIVENTSAVSVALSRRLLWSMLGAATPWEAHRRDSRAIHRLGQGADAAEGVTAFLEKRPPRFPGRVADHLDVVPDWPPPPADPA